MILIVCVSKSNVWKVQQDDLESCKGEIKRNFKHKLEGNQWYEMIISALLEYSNKFNKSSVLAYDVMKAFDIWMQW